VNYDEFYKSNPNYFGKPFPELIDYFSRQTKKGKLLDVGCGQGRNAIPLAKMGYEVLAIDTSSAGIAQINRNDDIINLHLKAERREFQSLNDLTSFDFILLDGFFHFNEHDKRRDFEMMEKLKSQSAAKTKLVFCFADHNNSVERFEEFTYGYSTVFRKHLKYPYVDPVSEWIFETSYLLAVLQ
jgi:SAM-dependent methyltransferase